MTGSPLSAQRRDLLARLHAAAVATTQGTTPGTAPDPARRTGRPEETVAVQPDGHRPPLFLLPAVSGSPYPYLPLRTLVHPNQPVDSFEARGLSTDERPLTTIPAIAADHLDAARRRWPAGPYLLGGWSFGATVALEMAHQLAAAGLAVGRLVLIDGAVPGSYPVPTDDEVADAFRADLAGYGLTPDAVVGGGSGPAGARRYAVFRANMRAHRAYRPRPWTGGAVVIRGARSSEPWRGWLDVVPGAAVWVVPGDHYSMWKPENVPALTAAIEAAVAADVPA